LRVCIRHQSIRAISLTTEIGQNICFHRNHPIQYVYLCGLVMQVDLAPGAGALKYALLVLDDSSGRSIEIKIPRRQVKEGDLAEYPSNTLIENVDLRVDMGVPDLFVDKKHVPVGSILKIKGTLTKFRERQIDLKRVFLVKSTNDEVLFWAGVAAHKRILAQPWILTDSQRAKADARAVIEEKRSRDMIKVKRKVHARDHKKKALKAERHEKQRKQLSEIMDAGALEGSNVIKAPWD